MNILQLCLSAGLGGLELYVFRSAVALSENHNVHVAVKPGSKLNKYFNTHSKLSSTHLRCWLRGLPVIAAYNLANFIDRYDIDVIHIHWGKDLALAALAKKLSAKKPALVYTRQMQITRSKDDFYHHFLYQQMDLMLTITRDLEEKVRSFIPRHKDKITTLYYGVSEPRTLLSDSDIQNERKLIGFNNNDFVVGLFGRLEEGKGQHLLIDAIAKASQQGHDLKALIVGHEMNDGYRKKLESMAVSLDISTHILFMDFVTDPQELMQLCNCVVLASRSETFGLVLPEAMRAGVAVIGSNKGGVPEIIDHGKTGLLFESGDSASLYENIIKLYNDKDLTKKLAEAGKNSADSRFNNTVHFKQLDKHLQSVTKQNTKRV